MRSFILALVAIVGLVSGDVYMHTPRGANNRLDDENRDRDNANRVCDTQNNNRGGSNRGTMYYYAGSVLSIDWTNQHGCGNPNLNCELIIQYYCDDKIRDGTTSKTIPIDPQNCYNFDCDSDVRYGRHESADFYASCLQRSRNKGLFTANQRLRGHSARYTRQNPNGDRRGLECPEERDYYPYWSTSPWHDIAVLTDNPSRCEAYQQESENVKPRWSCVLPQAYINARFNKGGYGKGDQGFIPITKEECEAMSYTDPLTNGTYYGLWTQENARNRAPPVCRAAPWTRDNHLGNTIGGYPPVFNWTIPDDLIGDNCILRLRYNISTGDYQDWENETSVQSSEVNANKSIAAHDANRDPAPLDVWSKYRLSYEDNADSFDSNKNNNQETRRNSREYVFKNNPQVDIFGLLTSPTGSKNGSIKLQLAINTNQFGRTFQDRSHKFAIKKRPNNIPFGSILNINVVGKRGNIVQVFPGTEYDFRPFEANRRVGEYVHFQWTGSNSNPQNNAGQGRAGTDRSNVIALRAPNYWEEGMPTWDAEGNIIGVTEPPTYGKYGNSYPQRLPRNSSAPDSPNTNWRFLGWDYDTLYKLATSQQMVPTPAPGGLSQLGGDLDELDAASTYFDLGPKQVTSTGIYHYLCTRNNNFSNRSQKSRITVSTTAIVTEAFDQQGGTMRVSGARMTVPKLAMTGLTEVTMGATPKGAAKNSFRGDPASDFITILPVDFGMKSDASVTVRIKYESNPIGSAVLYRADHLNGDWREVGGADFDDGEVTFSTTRGGVFVVEEKTSPGVVAGIVIGGLVALLLLAFVIYRYQCAGRVGTSGGKAAAPAGPAPIKSSGAAPASPSSDGGGRELPPGWQAVTDPNDGATYYVHATKGLSQWEFPES